ncbi:thiamine pyrophosphate-binding protein [Halosegnis longus]|uniref:thiamine pyrophosphate-binding protein n=1 Tax=Halosegnis longus TaxID=2216012 RepID=UPI00129E1C3E|nr:thiamine pyrophosphate-binding protein [Halosegnis longus]
MDDSSDAAATVGEAVVAAMAEAGIDAAFGIPGKQTLPLNEAMASNDIRYVVARHETAVSHQAWGYAETTGRPAATVVIPGPGDLNAANGLKNAHNDCTPLFHLAVETAPEVRGGDGIHETPPEVYDELVKANYTVASPASAAATVTEAVEEATTHPKGPVRVGIPKTFLGQTVASAAAGARDERGPKQPASDALARASALLADATRPALLAGGGVRASDAAGSLEALADHLNAPVVTTYKGKGTLAEDHPLSAGVLCGGTSPAVASVLEDADALLAVGTDFDAVATGEWGYDLPDRLVHVTYHASDIGTGYDPAVGILADADATLRALRESLPAGDGDGERRAQDARAADRARLDALVDTHDGNPTSVEALRAVREAVPREATVAVDAGGFRIWALVAFPAYGPRRYVNPGSWATMGTGLPSAIGATVANPDREVVALTGDGGLMMCLHELHTLAAESLEVTVVVFRNDDYAIISEEATRSYGLKEVAYGWGDTPVEFTALAESMGVAGYSAHAVDEIPATVSEARASDGPALVEVRTDPTEPQASEWMRR